jgi:hypothetical protein
MPNFSTYAQTMNTYFSSNGNGNGFVKTIIDANALTIYYLSSYFIFTINIYRYGTQWNVSISGGAQNEIPSNCTIPYNDQIVKNSVDLLKNLGM